MVIEVKSKIKDSLSSPECKEKRIAGRTGKKHTNETKKKIGETLKKTWLIEDYREKMRFKKLGSNNHRALLNEENVRQIRILWRDADKSRKGAIADFCDNASLKFKVNPPVIFRVIMCYSWKHVVLEYT